MTAPLPTPNTRDYSTQSLRSYRGAAASYLKSREDQPLCVEKVKASASSPTAVAATPCGSPPRFRPSHPSRCRSRTPSPPHQAASSTTPTPGGESAKSPRTISPGGTPASSAGSALRQAAAQQLTTTTTPVGGHRVRWAEDLVASCYTRPRTLRKDVSALFYSRADELRFRREVACHDEKEEETTDVGGDQQHPPLGSPKQEQRKDYVISKAVVVFGNSTKTYGGCALEATTTSTALDDEATESTFSFDDAAFWNGLLTWS